MRNNEKTGNLEYDKLVEQLKNNEITYEEFQKKAKQISW